MSVLDMGDLCVWCGEDTSFGSGRFVNRIPVSADVESTTWAESSSVNVGDGVIVEGFGCESCYEDDISL